MHALIKRARVEEGFVIIVALLIITILVVLAGTLAQSAVITSSNGNQDYAQKQALAGANAGIQAANYRLSNQGEDNTTQQKECFTTKFEPLSGGKCPGETDSLGNGVEYTYYVSPALEEAKNECAGLWVLPPSGKTVNQRCVTAIGKANGTTARVQERVADVVSSGTSLFPVNGMFSYTSLELTNNVKLAGEYGAREKVESSHEIERTGAVTLKYGTEVKLHKSCAEETVTCTKLTKAELEAAPYKLPTEGATQAAPYAASQEKNEDGNIKFKEVGGAESEFAGITGTREVNLSKNATITIPPGSYNLCLFSDSSEATIKYTPPVKLYIDSPLRSVGSPASTCKSGTGWVKTNNHINWKDESPTTKKGSDLEIFAWGDPSKTPESHSPEFGFTGPVAGPFYAMIYAPYSSVNITQELKLVGAIVGGWMKMTQNVELTGEGGGSGSGSGSNTGISFYATAFHVCNPTYSGNPASGCY